MAPAPLPSIIGKEAFKLKEIMQLSALVSSAVRFVGDYRPILVNCAHVFVFGLDLSQDFAVPSETLQTRLSRKDILRQQHHVTMVAFAKDHLT